MEKSDIAITLTPLILAIVAFLAMASLRNSDIATRSRACVDEYLYKSKLRMFERKRHLKEQNEQLITRYAWLSCASCLFIMSLTFIALVALLVNFYSKSPVSIIILYLALLCFSAGAIIVFFEFARGHRTLLKNSEEIMK